MLTREFQNVEFSSKIENPEDMMEEDQFFKEKEEYSDSSSHDSFKQKIDLLHKKNELQNILPELIAKIHSNVLDKLLKK